MVDSPTVCCRAVCHTLCGSGMCGNNDTARNCTRTSTTLLSSGGNNLNCLICAIPSKRGLVNAGFGLGPGTALNCSSKACCCEPSS